MIFVFSGKYDIFGGGAENERRLFLSKNAWKYGIFCIYAWTLQAQHRSPGKKAKMPLPQKDTPKGDISCITKKDGIHRRKYGISAELPR